MPSCSCFCKPRNGKLKNLIFIFSHSVFQVVWNLPLSFPVPVVHFTLRAELKHRSTTHPTNFSPEQRTETSLKQLQHQTVLTVTSAHFAYVISEQRVGKNALSRRTRNISPFFFFTKFLPDFPSFSSPGQRQPRCDAVML